MFCIYNECGYNVKIWGRMLGWLTRQQGFTQFMQCNDTVSWLSDHLLIKRLTVIVFFVSCSVWTKLQVPPLYELPQLSLHQDMVEHYGNELDKHSTHCCVNKSCLIASICSNVHTC